MPAPALLAAPGALKLLGWSAAGAAALYVAARARGERARPLHEEAALDGVGDGVAVDASRDAGRTRADVRAGFRRVLRPLPGGPGLEIEGALLGRLRVSRADAGTGGA
ncbi:MAG: hypothetical protein AAF192_19335 [Pseudomonadota bacterium]